MVEGYKENISSNDSTGTPDSKSGELIFWIRSLQQALTVEVDHGFTNIQGRTNKFSSFVASHLLKCPAIALPEHELCKLKKLALSYDKYSSMSTELRRRIIVQTRQSLHNLYKYQEIKEIAEPQKLKIRRDSDSVGYKRSSSADLLSLGSSISAVKGVGPKQAERLSALGLILIRDLLK